MDAKEIREAREAAYRAKEADEQEAHRNKVIKEQNEEIARAKENRKRQAEACKAQKATKYSDRKIRLVIDAGDDVLRKRWDAKSTSPAAAGVVAQAMIAYNNMIDERWKR